MNRREFTKGCVAAASAALLRRAAAQTQGPTGEYELDVRQAEIDSVTPEDFAAYLHDGVDTMPGRSTTLHYALQVVCEHRNGIGNSAIYW
jgi:hypothetical protein